MSSHVTTATSSTCILDPLHHSDPDEELDAKIFNISSKAINYLKDKASNNNDTNNNNNAPTKITPYNVVAVLIWRCKALSNCVDKDRVFTFLTAIDIRPRLNPPLPDSYCGNAVLFATASVNCEDLKKWPFAHMVKAVSDGLKRFTDEYARSAIDLLDINKGKIRPRIEYSASSWWRLGFDQVVYPWGKPVCSDPVMYIKVTCCLFPDNNGGIDVLVALPA